MHLLTEDKSAKKACEAMVPNPIYEGPLYESIQPEFSTLTTPSSTTNMMESRYLDNPIHPVMLNKASKSTDNGTAIGEVGTPNQNRKENAEREAPFLETHRHIVLLRVAWPPVHLTASKMTFTVLM